MDASIIGCVPYLNARPLVRQLELTAALQPEFSLEFEVPSALAIDMGIGEQACSMLSSVVWARNPHLRIVPDVAIASEGAVASVKLFSSTPISKIRTVAMDTSSLTSVALTRILLNRRYGISPATVDAPPCLPEMLAHADAALMIGDPCLLAEPAGCEQLDLGECWTDWTGLPFVWALWIGRSELLTDHIISMLQEARDWGVENLAQVISEEQQARPELAHLVDGYLRNNVSHYFTGRFIEGFERFRRELSDLGLA